MKNTRNQRGGAEAVVGGIIAFLFVCLLGALLIAAVSSDNEAAKHHRSKHHSKLVVTLDHKLYAHNDDDSWWEFIPTDLDGFRFTMPSEGASKIVLPSGSWTRVAVAPPASQVEEEEATVEETVEGQPSETGEGDMGSDSDSGGDSGGDGGDGGE